MFEVGDEIRCVNSKGNWYKVGDVHVVRKLRDKENVYVEAYKSDGVWVCVHQFELVEPSVESHNFDDDEQGWKLTKQPFIVDGEQVFIDEAFVSDTSIELGVARPILETRKVGKVQQHMVEDGFPNALRELAKVLTWAADAKQYKLHDWKNLPDPEIAFPSAGYRHKTDNSIQKAAGLKALERVDHESNLLHLAHEVFNKLAELELILTGVIK